MRRHLGLHAPTETGEIEAGPSHVHPELGPFAAPAAERFAALNAAMCDRAGAPAAARERWRIGEPYAGEEHRTVLIRPRGEDADPSDRRLPSCSEEVLNRGPRLGHPAATAGGGVALAVGGALVGAPLALLAVAAVPRRRGLGGRSLGGRRRAAPRPPAATRADRRRGRRRLRRAGRAAPGRGGLPGRGAAQLRLPALPAARRHTAGERALRRRPGAGAGGRPHRPLAAHPSGGGAGARALDTTLARPDPPPRGRRPLDRGPDDLATHRDRAEAYATAWRRHVGPTTLPFAHRGEGRDARAAAEAQPAEFDVQQRELWV